MRIAIGLVLLTAASLALRTGTLDSGYWIDEAIAVGIASHDAGDIPGLLRQDGSPPLHYLLLHGWMAIAGTGEAAARSLSLVFAAAAVPVAWWAGNALGGRRAATLAALGAAGSPFLTYYGQEARMYSLVALLSIVLAAAFVLAVVRGRRGHLVTLGVSAVALLYTHTWAVFLVAGVALAWLALGRAAGRAAPRGDPRARLRTLASDRRLPGAAHGRAVGAAPLRTPPARHPGDAARLRRGARARHRRGRARAPRRPAPPAARDRGVGSGARLGLRPGGARVVGALPRRVLRPAAPVARCGTGARGPLDFRRARLRRGGLAGRAAGDAQQRPGGRRRAGGSARRPRDRDAAGAGPGPASLPAGGRRLSHAARHAGRSGDARLAPRPAALACRPGGLEAPPAPGRPRGRHPSAPHHAGRRPLAGSLEPCRAGSHARVAGRHAPAPDLSRIGSTAPPEPDAFRSAIRAEVYRVSRSPSAIRAAVYRGSRWRSAVRRAAAREAR